MAEYRTPHPSFLITSHTLVTLQPAPFPPRQQNTIATKAQQAQTSRNIKHKQPTTPPTPAKTELMSNYDRTVLSHQYIRASNHTGGHQL